MNSLRPKVLVTGGAGFIGSNFVDMLVASGIYEVSVVDSLSYAGNLDNLREIIGNITFHKINITDIHNLEQIFVKNKFDYVVHFAAESHVDNSLRDPSVFVLTNVLGTQTLLDLSRKYEVGKFLHISTDEVYGSIDNGSFAENSPFNPSSPYSASKAGAEHLVNAAYVTFGLPINIVRCSNNYGQRQHKEKLIPLTINSIMENKQIPIYGNGNNRREWIHVADCCEAIKLVMELGEPGEIFNISSEIEYDNLTLVGFILEIMNASSSLIKYVEDRKGHDYRYSVDSSKLRSKYKWHPKFEIMPGLEKTIEWYLSNNGRVK